jgi:hypothetical protein
MFGLSYFNRICLNSGLIFFVWYFSKSQNFDVIFVCSPHYLHFINTKISSTPPWVMTASHLPWEAMQPNAAQPFGFLWRGVKSLPVLQRHGEGCGCGVSAAHSRRVVRPGGTRGRWTPSRASASCTSGRWGCASRGLRQPWPGHCPPWASGDQCHDTKHLISPSTK